MKKVIYAVVAAALAISGPASAVDVGHGVDVSANVSLATDYVWRGDSQTDERAAVQGGFDVSHDLGLYAGAWASNVDFDSRANTEIDVYGGVSNNVFDSPVSYDIGVIRYIYEDESDLNFNEVYGGLGIDIGVLSPSAKVYYDWDDENLYYEAAADVNLDIVTLSGHYGYADPDEGDALYNWGVGASVNLLTLDWGAHYTDKEDGDDRLFFSVGKTF